MSNLYVACELGAEKGRIFLGALQKEGLTVSDAGEIHNLTTRLDGVLQWDIPSIYQQVLGAVRGIVAQQEPVRGISFHSSATDVLLFDAKGSPIAPIGCPEDPTKSLSQNLVQTMVPVETLYEETGVQADTGSPLEQLASENPRRLKKASYALSLADGFNYLMSGVPRTEISQACQTQLFNPLTKSWSDRLLDAVGVPSRILPPIVHAGSSFGEVRPEIAREAGLEEARVIATCSNEMASALAALSIADQSNWAFLWPDHSTLLGTRLEVPCINEVTREMKYSNLLGYADSVFFFKRWVGLRVVEECRQVWAEQDRALDNEVLLHLATSATAFEALFDPADPLLLNAEDMPQAIQTFCRETGQEIPRKPGPMLRCIFESLAMHYRKGLQELEYITGGAVNRLYVLGGRSNLLLNHFLANALQIPIIVVPTHAAAVGNVVVQALALGHIETAEQASELVKHSCKMQTIKPHARAWIEAYDRFLGLSRS